MSEHLGESDKGSPFFYVTSKVKGYRSRAIGQGQRSRAKVTTLVGVPPPKTPCWWHHVSLSLNARSRAKKEIETIGLRPMLFEKTNRKGGGTNVNCDGRENVNCRAIRPVAFTPVCVIFFYVHCI